MKRLVLPLLVLIALLAAAVPSILGLRAEDVYRDKLGEFALPGILGVELLSYERGWLSSRAQVLIELELGSIALANPEVKKLTTFILQDTIYHGPFTLALGEFATRPPPAVALAVIDSALFFENEPALYKMLFAEAPVFISRTAVDFWGGMKSTVYSQPMKAEIEGLGATVNWKGFLLTSELAGQDLTYSIAGDGLTAMAQDVAFELHGWREEGRLTLHGDGPFTGEIKGSLDGAAASSGDTRLFEFEGLTYEKSTRQAAGLLTGEAFLEATPVAISGETYGPTVFRAEVSNVAAAQLMALAQSLNNTLAERPFAAEGTEQEGGQPGFIETLSESDAQLIIEALISSPRLTLSEFSFRTTDGDTTGSADVGFNGEGLPETLSSGELISRVYAEWNFQLPLTLAVRLVALSSEVQQRGLEQLLAQNPDVFPSRQELAKLTLEMGKAIIDAFIRQGYLSTDAGALTLAGSLKGGQLTIGTRMRPLGKEP